jgi:type III secretion protein Q
MAKPRATAPPPIAAYLPVTDEAAAQTARLMHDCRFLAACSAIAPAVSLAPTSTVPGGTLHRLRLRCDDGDIQVLFASPVRPALGVLAGEDIDIPPALAEAAVEVAFGPLIDALHMLGLAGARAVALHVHDNPTPPDGAWCVLRRDDDELATFQLPRLPEGVRESLRRSLRSLGPSPVLDGLALRGAVELSQRPVRRAALESLAPGDVLLLDAAAEPGPASCCVRFGAPGGRRWMANAVVDDTLITIEGEARMIDDDANEQDIDDEVGDLGALEVPVRFEVETTAVALRDLQAMRPGAVIALTTPLSSARVRLLACGRVVGHAELVAVGERLGARIIRMAASDDKSVD